MSGMSVLGVKVGRMGFLTEVEPDQASAVLERMLDGSAGSRSGSRSWQRARRSNRSGPSTRSSSRRARHRLIRLAVFVDDAYVTTFSADGVISATPTGSTAYSFSAGGPIVSPSVPCIVVTPIAAHMVFDRSLVRAQTNACASRCWGRSRLLSGGRPAQRQSYRSAPRSRSNAPRLRRGSFGASAPSFHDLVRDKFDLPGNVGGAVRIGECSASSTSAVSA